MVPSYPPTASKAKWLNNHVASVMSAGPSLTLQLCVGSAAAVSAVQTQTQSLLTEQIVFGVMNRLTIEILLVAQNQQLLLFLLLFFLNSFTSASM